jgi:tetratricopeptide (TPR) repeat protein
MRLLTLLFIVMMVGRVCPAQDLPVVRRLLILTPAFLNSAEARSEPAPIPGDKSNVLVLFRLSERGSVIDARATSGSDQAKRSAVEAVKLWRFKPTLLNSRPVQMMSGVVLDFSANPLGVHVPMPMAGDQISPVLSTRCSLALVKNDVDSVTICKKESAAVDRNRSHTAMESLSAHDELGLALLRFGQDARGALAEFNRAIELSPDGLSPADGEWAQLYWHRGAAEQQTGRMREAYQDFAIAEKSFGDAAEATPAGTKGYRDLLAQVTNQHGSLLEAEGRHEEATALLSKLGK